MKRVAFAGVAAGIAVGAWGACSVYDKSLLESAALDVPDGATADGGYDAPADAPAEDGCPPGFARCGTSACSVQLGVDPKNCGACGHDCQGAACLAAVCQPTLIASGQNGPSYVAVDNGIVYWTNDSAGTVVRANVDGTNRQIIATGLDTPWVIQATAGRVYFSTDTTGGAITALDPDGGAPVDLTGPQPSPRGFAVTSAFVFFDTADTDAGSVQRVQLDGGGLTVLVAGPNSPKDVVTDGTSVYWTALLDKTINRVPVGGGPPAVVANATAPFGLAIFGKDLFYTNRLEAAAGGSVGRIGIDGSNPIILAPSEGLPRSIALDGTFVYWTSESDGTIKRVPHAGGTVTTLATGQTLPWGIAVDDTFVYWAAKGAGLVLRVAK